MIAHSHSQGSVLSVLIVRILRMEMKTARARLTAIDICILHTGAWTRLLVLPVPLPLSLPASSSRQPAVRHLAVLLTHYVLLLDDRQFFDPQTSN